MNDKNTQSDYEQASGSSVGQQPLVRGNVTESLFDGSSVVPLAEVQHIEKRDKKRNAIMVIMKSTTYAFEQDEWMNPVYFEGEEATVFMTAWCQYRAELEHETLADISPANNGERTLEALTNTMSRLRNIPETCPIYKEAEHLLDCLNGEMEEELSDYLAERFTDYAKSILECVDRCRDISGELREMCVERGEKIEELEEKLGDLISA